MLTSKQKQFLRAQAHKLTPIFQVGKQGVGEAMTKQIQEALEARELLKVSILRNCEESHESIAQQLASKAGAELVQVIGHTVVLYKRSANNRRIELPPAQAK